MTLWRSFQLQRGLSPQKSQDLTAILVASERQVSQENSAGDICKPVPQSFKHLSLA